MGVIDSMSLRKNNMHTIILKIKNLRPRWEK